MEGIGVHLTRRLRLRFLLFFSSHFPFSELGVFFLYSPYYCRPIEEEEEGEEEGEEVGGGKEGKWRRIRH